MSEQVLAARLRSAEWKTEKLLGFLLFPIVYCLVLKGLRISSKWSAGRSVSTVFRQRTGKPRDTILISGRGKRLFFSSTEIADFLWSQPSFLTNGYWNRFPGGKAGRAWSRPHQPHLVPRLWVELYFDSPTRIHVPHRDNLTLPIYLLIYHIFYVNTTYNFEFSATCFDLNKSSFRHAYEPWLLQLQLQLQSQMRKSRL